MTTEAPLLALLRETIREEGPIGVDRFMALCLGHPRHGYYMTRDPLGAAGDFTTAPEISQMFGELVGVWCASVFVAMGRPEYVNLVELGPGRGTLLADLWRATRTVTGFHAAASVHLVETSPVLRERQAATLAGSGVAARWHAGIDTLPAGPLLVVANEFFDALPVRQYLRTDKGWTERLVGLAGDGALAFGAAATPEPALGVTAPAGTMLEVGLAGQALMAGLAAHIARDGGAALVVDYGSATSRFGETLQALRGHRFADPLEAPGEADLTTHVDFAALARAAAAAGASVHGPVSQGDFLHAMGIAARAERLSRGRPGQVATVEAALDRLAGPAPGMGDLFKVLGITAATLGAPPGFAPA